MCCSSTLTTGGQQSTVIVFNTLRRVSLHCVLYMLPSGADRQVLQPDLTLNVLSTGSGSSSVCTVSVSLSVSFHTAWLIENTAWPGTLLLLIWWCLWLFGLSCDQDSQAQRHWTADGDFEASVEVSLSDVQSERVCVWSVMFTCLTIHKKTI